MQFIIVLMHYKSKNIKVFLEETVVFIEKTLQYSHQIVLQSETDVGD